ncbi:MAG: hypothetical protein KDC92_05380 [Bacteroidetes bacterium]|nr:hypothetical protein [Bacteroidota bacterium]
MKNFNFKKLLPHVGAILGLLIISAVYFKPALEGLVLSTNDIKQHGGMAKEVLDFREKTGEMSLWTNSMFGGMPTYQIANPHPNTLWGIKGVYNALAKGLAKPINMLFLSLLGAYFMLLAFKADWRLALLGALAYGFSSYNFYIIEAGHNTKALALGFAPMLIGAVQMALGSKKWWLLGAALAGITMAFEIKAGHVQITYYAGLILLGLGIVHLVKAVKENDLKGILVKAGVLVVMIVLGVGSNAGNLMTVAELTPETTRGKSELTKNNENKSSGLDEDYATGWSYGVAESWTMVLPNLMGGGGSNKQDFSDLESYRILNKSAGAFLYWGNQPSVSGPIYLGAGIVALFLIGCVIVNAAAFNWLYWITFLGIVLAWGRSDAPWYITILAGTGIYFILKWIRNPEAGVLGSTKFQKFLVFGIAGIVLSWVLWSLYDSSEGRTMSVFQIFFNYVPGFNKFRTVSMALVIPQMTVPLMAILAIIAIFKRENRETLKRAIIWVGGGLSIIVLLLTIMPSVFFELHSANSDRVVGQYIPKESQQMVINSLISDRGTFVFQDGMRSLFFILAICGALYAFVLDKLKQNVVVAAITALVLIDLGAFAWRYLKHDDFTTAKNAEREVAETRADQQINQDTSHYRVMNLSVNTFNDATTSYHHLSMGGYHGAKLKRIQELIEYRISGNPQSSGEISKLYKGQFQNTSQAPVLNMFNTKYFIVPAQKGPAMVVPNRDACGNAWFVDSVQVVANADEEIAALANFDPTKTAFIDQRYQSHLDGLAAGKPNGTIKLVEYKPNYLRYECDIDKEGFAVFSEAYYRGNVDWISTIDNEKADHIRTNYHLRGMRIPAGKHTIEFKFDPPTYAKAESYSFMSSLALILVLLGSVAFSFLQARKEEPAAE